MKKTRNLLFFNDLLRNVTFCYVVDAKNTFTGTTCLVGVRKFCLWTRPQNDALKTWIAHLDAQCAADILFSNLSKCLALETWMNFMTLNISLTIYSTCPLSYV